MSYKVDFKDVSTIGLETTEFPDSVAGLRANEARYFMNKFKHEFVVEPASESTEVVDYVASILKERGIVIESKPLETSQFEVEGIKYSYVFYQSGLVINVMYTLAEDGKRAVGIKLSENMEIPLELAGKFKFARQRSKLAGIIRGSFFVIKRQY